ncbi:MAG: hypothetical protein AAGJ93_08700 [Bacteroidota bacterium]
MNKINSTVELHLAIDITMNTILIRLTSKVDFQDKQLYTKHWDIINNRIKRAISAGSGGVELALIWDDLEPDFHHQFLEKLKHTHQ